MKMTQAGYFMSLHKPVTVEELKNAKAKEISALRENPTDPAPYVENRKLGVG